MSDDYLKTLDWILIKLFFIIGSVIFLNVALGPIVSWYDVFMCIFGFLFVSIGLFFADLDDIVISSDP